MTDFPQWNEIQWKNEIRQHEESVASFFQDLVYCLDLPLDDLAGESPGTSGNPSETVTAGANAALKQWIRDHEEEDNEDAAETDYEPRHPVCFSCVDSIDQLAVTWNNFSASLGDKDAVQSALAISCAFAKLLARSADFTEPAKQCTPQLLTTLGKLAVHDLEELAARLDEFASELPEHTGLSAYFLRRLALVREQLIEKLNELK